MKCQFNFLYVYDLVILSMFAVFCAFLKNISRDIFIKSANNFTILSLT